MRAGLLLVLLSLLLISLPIRAQPFSPRLPSLQGGDYGNGAATSDIAGGAFLRTDIAPRPAIAFGIPAPFGPDAWDVFAGAGLQNGLRGDQDFTDGAAFFGGGLGNASKTVGLEITLAAYDLVGETGKDGSLSWKLHRRLGPVAVGLGVENAWIFGTTDGGRSRYGVAGTVLPIRAGRTWISELAVVGGMGDGRFTRWRDIEAGSSRWTGFGTLSLRVHRRVGVFGTWTGQNLNGGVSVAPFPRLALVVTPVVLDLAGRHSIDQKPRLAVGGGLAMPIR